MTASTDF